MSLLFLFGGVAAAPAGGFQSTVIWSPYGFGLAKLNLTGPGGTITVPIAGTVSSSGDLSFKLGLAQSGSTGIAGTFAVTGELAYLVPTLPMVQSGSIAVAGTVATTGALAYGLPMLDLVQSGVTALSGTLASSGDVEFLKWDISQAGAAALFGTLATSGNLLAPAPVRGFRSLAWLNVYGFGKAVPLPINLVQSGVTGITGTVAASGNVVPALEWEFAAPIELQPISGTLGVSGNLGYILGTPFFLVQSGRIAVTGTLASLGTVGFKIPISQTGTLTTSGVLGVSGELRYGINLIQSGRIGVTGTTGVSGDTAYDVGARIQIHSLGVDQPPHIVLAGAYVDAVGPLNLVASPISIGGAVIARGNINLGIPFDMGAGYIGVAGTLDVHGNVVPIYSTFTCFGRDRIGRRHEHDPDPRIGRATLLGGIPRVGSKVQ